MTIWIIYQKTDFCETPWEEKIYNAVSGVIYCFCFFNLQEGQSRWRALTFYLIIIFQVRKNDLILKTGLTFLSMEKHCHYYFKILNKICAFLLCATANWRKTYFQNLTCLTVFLMWFAENTPKLALTAFIAVVGGTLIGKTLLSFFILIPLVPIFF